MHGAQTRPEMDLLIAAAVAGTGLPIETGRLLAALRSGVDWAAALPLAAAHRSLPLLHRLVSLAPQAPVPAGVRAELSRAHMASVARSAALWATLAEARAPLETRRIPVRVIKGPALAALAYVDPSLRVYDDIDLLVPRDRFVEARRALEAAGFKSCLGMNDAEAVAHMRAGWDTHLRSSRTGIMVELCTGVCPAYFLRPPEANLWRSAIRVSEGGEALDTLGADVLFLVLCVHGMKHAWTRVAWVADLAGLLVRGHAPDWGRTVEQARTWGSVRILIVGAALACRLGGNELPSELQREAGRDPAALAMADALWERLRSGVTREPSGMAEVGMHLRARERLRDRARHLALLAFTPSHGDWRVCPLPAALFPLYYIIRPFRLAGQRILRRARH